MACKELPTIKFGDLVSNDAATLDPPFDVGDQIRFDCKMGYRRSVLYTTCQPDGTWDPVQCFPVGCGEPEYLENGTRDGHLFTFPNKIVYRCNEGYKFKNGQREQSYFCSAQGEWTPSFKHLECVPDPVPPVLSPNVPVSNPNVSVQKCPPLTHPAHGRVRVDDGTTATYTCDAGYDLLGKSTRTCQNGAWTESEPTCFQKLQKQCPDLPPTLDVISRTENHVTFKCYGREVKMECRNGSWTLAYPYCIDPRKRRMNPSPPISPKTATSPPISPKTSPKTAVVVWIGVSFLVVYLLLYWRPTATSKGNGNSDTKLNIQDRVVYKRYDTPFNYAR